MSERTGSQRWQQVEALYHAALEREPAERAAWLAAHCGGDADLHREVESLLAYDDKAAQFIEAPALEVAARGLAEDQKQQADRRQIGAYKILSRIGGGGMGEVYVAEDTRLGRRVAIKFLPAIVGDDPQARKRFLREARAAAALDHPNICAIHEVSEADGQPFIVMQYITGETLADRLRRAPLAHTDALDFAIQIADALSEAHSHYIIHRDIKPANIIINARRQVKVLDFGLAKILPKDDPQAGVTEMQSFISTPGVIVGTAPYMSPEQARGEPLDARTDIFSFGIVLYEMVSNRSPFAAATRVDTLLAVMNDEPPPLARYRDDAPDQLQRIISKALSKDREQRYQAMRELLKDLKRLRDELRLRDKLEPPASLQAASTQAGEALNPAPPAPVGPALVANHTEPSRATPLAERLRRGFARVAGWLKSL